MHPQKPTERRIFSKFCYFFTLFLEPRKTHSLKSCALTPLESKISLHISHSLCTLFSSARKRHSTKAHLRKKNEPQRRRRRRRMQERMQEMWAAISYEKRKRTGRSKSESQSKSNSSHGANQKLQHARAPLEWRGSIKWRTISGRSDGGGRPKTESRQPKTTIHTIKVKTMQSRHF